MVKRVAAERVMGKETDLWDDSALINAFDQALNKYKVPRSFSIFAYFVAIPVHGCSLGDLRCV